MDIVEKLRGRSEYERHLGVELIYLYHMDVENICNEIERLREGLMDIVPYILEWEQFHIDENGVKHDSGIVQEIADGVDAKIKAILAP